MTKDEFDIAIRIMYGKTIELGDVINIRNEHFLYDTLYVRGIGFDGNKNGYSLSHVSFYKSENTSFGIFMSFDDILTKFHSFGL